jgi:site-specific recombinase XerD
MVYTFARVSAVAGMNVEDYYQQGKRWWVRLHEKSGKHHELPVHHKAEEYLDAYIKAARIADQRGTPLWRCMTKELDRKHSPPVSRGFGDGRMARQDIFRMIKRRCRAAALGAAANCHTFRATGITAYLLNGGSLENAQAIAAHESLRTTKLYDRTSDEITLDEIERIGI